jgi:tetratricopeptide (TPR) repeat protein
MECEALARAARAASRWAEASELAAELRARFPDRPSGWMIGTNVLRHQRHFDDCAQLLSAAMERFHDEFWVEAEFAWLARSRGDWDDAIGRAVLLRQRRPDDKAGWMIGLHSLRRARRLDEAEALFQEAKRRFRDYAAEDWVFLEGIQLSQAKGAWDEMLDRSAVFRSCRPSDERGWQFEAAALRGAGRTDAVEKLLAEAAARFPGSKVFLVDEAKAAQQRGDFQEADRRWARAAEAFPDDSAIALEFALAPARALREVNRDWVAVFQRLDAFATRFPEAEEGYAARIDARRRSGQLDVAEAEAASYAARFPESAAIARELARALLARHGAEAALRRMEEFSARFADDVGMVCEHMALLSLAGRFAAADELAARAEGRFPQEPVVLREAARVAVRRGDWGEAVRRWTRVLEKFPDDWAAKAGLFEARLAATESATVPAEDGGMVEGGEAAPTLGAVVENFESLGGTGQGCEFGIVQRLAGIEPLGLLRWTHIPVEKLIALFEDRFAGVGSPEQTTIEVDRAAAEYFTLDTKYVMRMHTFIKERDHDERTVLAQCCRRLKFLVRKLIEDLESGGKMFVYKIYERQVTLPELLHLRAAMASYGDNWLLYVQRADEANPPGSARLVQHGLVIGYIDQFSMNEFGEARTPSLPLWQEICSRALRLRTERAGAAAAA